MPGPERRLAAILFTDIVGYTGLMAGDEEKGLRAREAHRSLVRPLVERYGGECVEVRGDESLSTFSSARDAVNCALAILGSTGPSDQPDLHVGVHLGDIVADAGEISGDGVNIAARLCALSDGRSVLVSDQIAYAVRNQSNFELTSLGPQDLKNVGRRVEAFSVQGQPATPSSRPDPVAADVPDRSRWWVVLTVFIACVLLVSSIWWLIQPWPLRPVVERASPTSVVVLPFDDMSEGGDYAYFAAGLSEELTSVLAGLPGLRVIGRTSAEAVKRRGIGVGEIGSELGVGAVVEGSVRRADGRLRVTVQLIETEDGFHIWTDSYDRPIGDVFRIQSEIASDISAAMDPRLKAARTIPPTANVGAYDAYLTGRHMVGRQTPAAMRRAIERFEESIRQDPEFSLAYSGLADALVLSWTLGFDDAESVVPRAREAARRAVATGPDSAEAHTSMGRIRWMDRDWEASEASLRRAISLRPGYAFAHSNLALVLINRGRLEEGLAASRRAVDLEPLSPFMHVNLAMNQASARQHEDAIRSARRAGVLQPNNAIATGIASISLAHLGRTAESAEEILGSGLPAEIEARLRAAYEAEGITGFRRAYLKLQTARSDDPCGGSGGVVLYALLGDHDIVIDCLAAGIHRPGAYVNLHLAHNQAFDLVRDAPRFQAILHEAGLAARE